MPRSFLVKKSCSHRIPNYGQLLEAQADVAASCGTCTGVVLSLLQQADAPTAERPAGELWWTRPALSPSPAAPGPKEQPVTASPHSLGSRVSDAISLLATGQPLKDSMNNLNMPPRRRASDGGSVVPGARTTQHQPPQREAARQPDSLGCSDCHRACGSGLQQRHGPARGLFSCQHCAKAYTSPGALKMHIRTHTLPCACRICGKAFSRPWLLQGHIRTHTGEKPFSCFHCGRGFADRSNLRAHLQTHSEVKRYRCPGCGKTFSRVSLLAKHRDGCCCPVS